MQRVIWSIFAVILISGTTWAQQPLKPSASQIYESIKKLNFLGSALYVAAHPDDENTRLISYLANNVKARTAYLSLTRGDGGQNLIGPEIRELLGVIRTQELLGARSVDGGSQFFTRANDFGYSKHPDETLAIWNKNEVLRDVVLNMRKFKPDIIINRFNHRTPGSTHGHHTSSAMLSVEAFDLLNDSSIYPESATTYGLWKPTRIYMNTGRFFYRDKEEFDKAVADLIPIETGTFYTSTGLSNGEIAALSRSMHRSQAFGSTGVRGSMQEWLELLKGDMPEVKADLFEGINTTWSRIAGGQAVGDILEAVEANFNFTNPAASVPELLKAKQVLEKLPDGHWKGIKLAALDQIILDCAGVFIEAVANKQAATKNGDVSFTIEVINRTDVAISLGGIKSNVISFPDFFTASLLEKNKKLMVTSVENTFNAQQLTAPYWLKEPGTLGMYAVENSEYIGLPQAPDQFVVNVYLNIEGVPFQVKRNAVYKFNDRVKGEVYRPFDVLPKATSAIAEKVIVFSSTDTKTVPVIVRAGEDNLNGTVKLNVPEGWAVTPNNISFTIEKQGQTKEVDFMVTPSNEQSQGYISPLITVGDDTYSNELIQIDYDHIPFQNVLMPSKAKVVRIPIAKKGEAIAYVSGAGDAIPESLKQIGYNVTTLEVNQLNEESLASFDALVFGVRAFNVLNGLKYKQEVINNYVAQGGNVIVQYNTSWSLITEDFGPYPITLSRDRVTDENATVTILNKEHPALNSPNKITQADFNDWVQERGLYFPDEWDDAYQAPLQMNDINETPKQGALLIAKHGKGYFVYTGLSFFRELPAGVSGAYRLFANLLSLGK